jgi:hypothetical protein
MSMKNKSFAILMALTIGCITTTTTWSQPTANPTNYISPSILGGVQQITDALKVNNTNWIIEVHALRAPALPQKYGGGIGLFYPFNEMIYAGVRVDWVNGGFWMPSGSVGVQLPIKLTSWFKLTPFTYGGLAVPLSGAKILDLTVPGHIRDNNGQATAILGYGLALQIYEPASHKWNLSVAVDNETWSGFAGEQHRYALLFHKKF